MSFYRILNDFTVIKIELSLQNNCPQHLLPLPNFDAELGGQILRHLGARNAVFYTKPAYYLRKGSRLDQS